MNIVGETIRNGSPLVWRRGVDRGLLLGQIIVCDLTGLNGACQQGDRATLLAKKRWLNKGNAVWCTPMWDKYS
jgi:hypothetical protein